MRVYVMLYGNENDGEGIHSLELEGNTVVLMFEDPDDAERYCGLLEAQDFPKPNVEEIDREEIEIFCSNAGYLARYVNSGFIPEKAEDRLLLSPPEASIDVSNWDSSHNLSQEIDQSDEHKPLTDDLEVIKRKLEELL